MNIQQLPGLQQFNLTKKVAIITGGSKGLGLAMGAGLASAGANIILSPNSVFLESGHESKRLQIPLQALFLLLIMTVMQKLMRN